MKPKIRLIKKALCNQLSQGTFMESSLNKTFTQVTTTAKGVWSHVYASIKHRFPSTEDVSQKAGYYRTPSLKILKENLGEK
jgi:hypothetical protein